ncbi:MAG: BatA domain-containing protein [Gemmatimonadaceae bacterium]|nr:BatA domain-containing protein [Gemmatimonadaceae bacterium]
MTFGAPGYLLAGALGALGVVALHLIATARARPYVLPTMRFLPDAEARASRQLSRPRDLLLLALRALAVLALGAGFADPRVERMDAPERMILVVDRSRSADSAALRRAVEARRAGADIVIGFDSVVSDSVLPSSRAPGRLTVGLLAAARASDSLWRRGERARTVLLSAFTSDEVDVATHEAVDAIRGALEFEEVGAATAPQRDVRWRVTDDHPFRVAAPVTRAGASGGVPVIVAERADASDSALARGGGALVLVPSAGDTDDVAPRGVAWGTASFVAPLAMRSVAGGGAVARWADGAPAIVERPLGAGCVREVGVAIPSRGDVATRAGARALARAAVAPCGEFVARGMPLEREERTALLAGRADAMLPSRSFAAFAFVLALAALLGEGWLRRAR